MKFIFPFLLFPLFSISQTKITVFVYGREINESSKCPFYAQFEEQKANLLDSNLYELLLVQDSFYICGKIGELNFKSNSLKLMKNIKDSILISLDSLLDLTEEGIFVCPEDPFYYKIEINSIRDECTYVISSTLKSVRCEIRPAYYLKGKAIYDEDPKENRKRRKQVKKQIRQIKKQN